jgi:hypothetical protein
MQRVLFALAAVSLCCVSALSQGTKTLLLDRPLGNDPIRVTHIMVGTTTAFLRFTFRLSMALGRATSGIPDIFARHPLTDDFNPLSCCYIMFVASPNPALPRKSLRLKILPASCWSS